MELKKLRAYAALPYRLLVSLGVAGLVTALAAACGPENSPTSNSTPRPTAGKGTPGPSRVPAEAREGQLGARSVAPVLTGTLETGTHPLGIGSARDGLVYVPSGYTPDRPAGLVVLLHGSGGSASGGLSLLEAYADEANLILFAPDSRGQTWDIIMQDYGPDVRFIDGALERLFSRYAIDPSRIAIGGFSDGASYALSLGLVNGELFTHIISFSPGFMAPPRRVGKPRIFNAHGTDDRVLPIDVCSRRIVPQLRDWGYDVTYREFGGPHTVPADIAREAVGWLTGGAR
jgi:phospholipase/carboxylesterase